MQTVERERREAVQQLEGYLADVRSQLAASVSKGKADATETEARIKVLHARLPCFAQWAVLRGLTVLACGQEKDMALRRLQKQVATFEDALKVLDDNNKSQFLCTQTRLEPRPSVLLCKLHTKCANVVRLQDAAAEIDELRHTVSDLQREKGTALLQASASQSVLSGLKESAEAAQEEALQALANDAGTPVLRDPAAGKKAGAAGGSWLPWRK